MKSYRNSVACRIAVPFFLTMYSVPQIATNCQKSKSVFKKASKLFHVVCKVYIWREFYQQTADKKISARALLIWFLKKLISGHYT